jgi:hypothetical protein
VRFLIVGGYAVAFHGRPRATKDLDVWVEASPENAPRPRAAFCGPLADRRTTNTTVDFETRKLLSSLCDPKTALAPDDPRYVDLDAAGARGASFGDGLASRIELSDRPVMQLVTATPGAGLSTELRRVAARLARADLSGARLTAPI